MTMRTVLSAFFLFAVGASNGQTPGQTPPTPPVSGYRVTITDSKSGKTNNVHASRLAGGQFFLVASGGTIAIPASTISAADSSFPRL